MQSFAVRGIDVSTYQGAIDWAKVKASAYSFAFAKATEGEFTVDDSFAENWAAIKSAGMLRGAYHFFRPYRDAAAQAQHFLTQVQLGDEDLPPAVDVEVRDRVEPALIVAGLSTFADLVVKRTGHRPIIYTSPDFWINQLANPKSLTDLPLWIAHYTTGNPIIPGGWSKFTFWQFASTGNVDGIAGSVDTDLFSGSYGELLALARASSADLA